MKENKPDNSLSKLQSLLAQPKKLSCIDLVEVNLDEIILARDKKITWNVIAESLNMQRCTLINAVNTLLKRNINENKLISHINKRERKFDKCKNMITKCTSSFSGNINKTEIKSMHMTNYEAINNELLIEDSTIKNGVQALGRTRIDDFNL